MRRAKRIWYGKRADENIWSGSSLGGFCISNSAFFIIISQIQIIKKSKNPDKINFKEFDSITDKLQWITW